MSTLSPAMTQKTRRVKFDDLAWVVRRYGVRLFGVVSAFIAGILAMIMPHVAQAQTPVPITIDTNSLLTQVNTWTTSLDDVVFLGVAIAIAIAILTFIGSQILNAFRSAGR